MCVAALIVYAIGSNSIPVLIVSIACGLNVGAIAGHRFPLMTDAILWIVSLFG